MNRKQYEADNLPTQIVIGRQTETGVMSIYFDCTGWLTWWPNLTLSIWVTPPGGSSAYLATTHMEDKLLVWDVDNADTATAGQGTMEIVGTASGQRKLSAVTATKILASTTTKVTNPPEKGQSFLDQMAATTAKAEDATEAAKAAAAEADAAAAKAADITETATAAETDRVQAESIRAANEQNRVDAEGLRADAETGRAQAESDRATAETQRQSAEQDRAIAEQQRATAETARAEAETQRESAEAERRETFAGFEGEIGSLKDDLTKYIPVEVLDIEWVENKYMNTGGNILDANGYGICAKPLKLKKNEVLCFEFGTNDISNVACIYENKQNSAIIYNFSKLIKSGNGKEKYYYICTKECETLGISAYMSTFNVTKGYITDSSVEKYDDTITTSFNNGYISNTGAVVSTEEYEYSNLIKLKQGEKLIVFGYAPSNIPIISQWTSDDRFMSNLVMGSNYGRYEHTAKLPIEFVKVQHWKKYSDVEIYIQKSQIFDNDYLKYVIEDVVCIGDSITEGYFGQGVNDVRPNYSYPTQLAKMLDCNVTRCGISGATPKTFYTVINSGGIDYNFRNEYLNVDIPRHIPTSYSSYKNAIICLGTNEGLTDTISDTPNTETNTGCYQWLIEKLKTDNPNMNIFICTIPYNSVQSNNGQLNTTNEVIKKLANKYSLTLLDLNNGIINKETEKIYKPVDTVHFGQLGYVTLASEIKRLIIESIILNYSKYQTNVGA